MENFIFSLQAALDQAASKRQVNSDIKELQKSINMLRLTATLLKGDSKKAINQVVRQMEGQLSHIKLKAKIDQRNLKADVNKALSNISFDDIDMNFDSSKVKLKAKKVIADVKKAVQSSPISVNIEIKKEKLDNQLTAYLSKNSKIKESQNLLNEADKLREKISQINDKDSLRDATDNFQLFKSEVQATGYQAKSAGERIKGLIGNVTKIGSSFGVASVAISNFQKSLKTIKLNDDLLTEISKTSNSTKQELEELGDTAYQTASKFGQLSSDYLTAVQEMNRSGYYGEAGKALGELSLKAQAAGDISADVAQKYLLATSAAYDYKGSVEKLDAVLSGQNAITNKFSTDMDTMASATTKAGSVAANAGVKIDELSAMIGTISSRTKEAGEKTGTGIKSLLVNLQNTSSDKIVNTLDRANASMTETVNGIEKLRNPIDILKDLAKTYNALDESAPLKSEITTNIGQKYHANQLSSLLSGWSDYEKMLKAYSEGMGSADIEAQKTADSLSGRLSALQNSWDSFVNTVTNKDAFKNVVSLFDGLINSAERLIDVFDVIPVAMAGITAFKTAKDKDYGLHIFDDKGNFDLSGNFFGIDITAMKEQKDHYQKASIAIDRWNQMIESGVTDVNLFNDEIVKNNKQLREYLSNCTDGSASLKGYQQSLKAAGVETNSLRLGTILLNSALSLGIGMAVQGIITAIANYANSVNDAIDASHKAKETIDEANSTLKAQQNLIKESGRKYAELAQHVNQFNNTNLDLKEDEYEKFLDLSNQIAEQFPDLIKGYDDNGNAILNLDGTISDINSTLDIYIEKAKEASQIKIVQAFKGEGDNEDYFKGAKYEIDELEDKANTAKTEIENLQKLKGIIASKSNDLPDFFNDYSRGTDSRLKADYIRKYLSDSGFDKKLNDMSLLSGSLGNLTQEEMHSFEKAISDRHIDGKLSDHAIITLNEILSKHSEESGYNISDYITQQIKVATDDYNQFANDVETKNKEIAQNAQAVLEQSVIWSDPDTTDQMRTTMTNALGKIDWSDGQFEGFDGEQAAHYIQTVFASSFEKLSNDDKITVDKFFESDPGKVNITEYINLYEEIKAIFEKQGIHIPINIDNIQNVQDDFNKSLDGMSDKDKETVKKYLSDHGIDSSSELDIWNKRTEGITNATEAIQAYEKKAQEVSQINSADDPISFAKSWRKLGKESDEDTAKEHGEAKEKLLELAEAGKLTTEAFQESSVAQTILNETKLSAEEATQKINDLIENVKQLDSMRTGISSITSAYDEKKDSKQHIVSSSTLDSMYDTLGIEEWDKANKKVWENYKKCATDGKKSMADTKKAQDELATSYVNSNNFLANLDDTNDDYYRTLLTEMGVTNAGTIVTNELAKKKGLAAIETADLTNMASDEIAKLIEEKGKTDEARNAMKLFALEKVYANGKSLDTTEDINQLVNLMDSLGLASSAVKTYRDYLSGKFDSDIPGVSAGLGVAMKIGAEDEISKAKDKLKTKVKAETSKINTTKGNKTKDSSGSSKKKSSTKKTKTEIDWIARLIDRTTTKVDILSAKLQNLFNVKSKNSNLNKQIKQTTKLINSYDKAVSKYTKKANSVKLSSGLKKQVREGKIKGKLKDLIKKYGEKTANKIQAYQDYYDKAQDAKKNKASQVTAKRELKEQKLQNWVDLYDSRTARAEAKESIQTNAKDKNKAIDTQIKNINKSYEKQITIAEKISKDKAGKDRLEYERQQKIRELQEQKLQNYVDEYNASADLAEISSSNAIGYEKQNGFINEQLSWLKKSYDKQIAIAKLNGDITEEKRLQAEYDAKEAALKQEQIDNLKKDYENKIGFVNNDKQDISNSLAETEARGDIVQAGFYSSLNSYEEKVLANLREELERLRGEQNTFDIYSQEWYGLQSDIQSVENSISEANISIIENNKKIGELRQAMYDDIAERNNNASSEAQFLAGFLGDNLTDDKTGNLTKEGLGVLGTYGIELEGNTNTALSYKQDREEIEKAIAAFNSGNAHALDIYGSLNAAEEKLADVIKKQQEAITAEYSSMKDIYDLMVKRYDAQLAYMKSIIDAKKQVLDMEKDLYDYEKNISNQTKNIATLEKQLTALKGDDSEEGRAKRAKLQVSLDEANQELQDTEYERYISDQQNMLDNMYTQYEDLLTALEKDFETVVNEGIKLINETAGGISQTLNSIAARYNYVTTQDMKSIMGSFKENGLTKLETIFNKLADEIRKSYNGGNGGSAGNGGSGNNNNGNNPTTDNPSTGGTPNRDKLIEQGYEDEVKLFLAEHSGKKGNKNKPLRPVENGETFSSDLNKKLAKFGYIVKDGTGSGGVKYINMFAQLLGLMSGDSSFKSSGAVYKALQKKYPNAGFRTGGIVRADGVPKDGDNVPVWVNPDETILTQDFTKMLPETVDIMKDFVKVPDYARLVQPRQMGNNQNISIDSIKLELPNVKDYRSFREEMKEDPTSRRMAECIFTDCARYGKITHNIQRF